MFNLNPDLFAKWCAALFSSAASIRLHSLPRTENNNAVGFIYDGDFLSVFSHNPLVPGSTPGGHQHP